MAIGKVQDLEPDEVFYYGELDRVVGAVFIGMKNSFEGYRVLYFKRGRKVIAVFIDFPSIL